MRFVLILVLAFAKWLPDASGQDKFMILNTKTSETVSIDELVEAAAQHEVVFFGEQHDDSLAHALQLAVFEGLISRKGEGKVTLSMEMFHTDVQPILNEYLAGLIPEKLFEEDARAWPNYETDYKPLVLLAKEKGVPVVAANAARRYVRTVAREGQEKLLRLPKASKRFLPKLPIEPLDGRYKEKFFELMGGMHADASMMNFYTSQNLWDATMAWSIYRAWRKNKKGTILHLCGRFHSDERLGTVEHLSRYRGKRDVLVISCPGTEAEESADPEELNKLADYVIVRDSN